MKTLDQIIELYRAYLEAKEAHYQSHVAKPKDFDDSENYEYALWALKTDRLCRKSVRTGDAYRAACDEFFAKGCPDLIQLLVDIDEHFDGQEDIDSNGGPNFAMRCGAQIEAFLGPRPAQQAAE